MRFRTQTSRTAEFRGRLRVGITELAVGAMLVIGLTASHSSWAQQCQRALYLEKGAEHSQNAVNYPIILSDVTLGNQITWAAQAFVAPERLEGLVPLYVYETDMNGVESLVKTFEDVPKGGKLHLGWAIYMKDGQGDKQEVWRARPYSPDQNLGTARSATESGAGDEIQAESADSYSLCIVSSKRLGDVPAVEELWIPEAKWQEGEVEWRKGLPQVQ